jgi:hypothetical protein
MVFRITQLKNSKYVRATIRDIRFNLSELYFIMYRCMFIGIIVQFELNFALINQFKIINL